ncbi:MAG: hypothetical protein GY697_00835 [Desulfobacterales bacterium]|nr:hypothetical protein [Desulfobacterales bacterium]
MALDTPPPDQNAELYKNRPNTGNPKLIVVIIIVAMLAAAAAGLWLTRRPEAPAPGTAKPTTTETALKVKNQPVIEYQKDESNQLMTQRKATLGIKDGLDMIVKEGESIKVGDQTISVKEISDSIQAKEGGITEKDLTSAITHGTGAYGIYIVQPGDNIWNIHFKLIKAYLAGKKIALANESDEPDHSGYSSGIGKLLKFSENMVYIYSIRDRQLVTDINLIRPLTKIVIYRMDRVFDLLDQVDYHNAGRIRFDGENIWIPAE